MERLNAKEYKKHKNNTKPIQCNFCACFYVMVDAMSGFVFEIAHRKSDFGSNNLFLPTKHLLLQ